MSTTLHARGLAAGHGERLLFSDLDLILAPGDVIGLVGVNGAGKSTLLRMLADGDAHEGEIVLSPPDATVGYLAQEPERVAGETVLEFLRRRTGVAAAQQIMDSAAERLADGGDDEYSPALERWLALGGADLEQRADEVAADLGLAGSLPHGLDTPMTVLSGGQAARAGLASVLLSRFDILLLDEPTNDLDLDGLARLEQFVTGVREPLMVISHDREFLARTVNRIVELDLAQQQVGVYDGGYDSYLEEREIARRHAREAYDEFADTKAGLEARANMQRNWMEHGVRNARRKSKADSDKMGRKARAESTEKQASKVKQTLKRIERLDAVEEPRKEWELRMSIAAAPRSGAVVATLSGATVSRGDFTLGPVTVQVDWGDRIVLTGANGAGKSTLLSLLLGKMQPDNGSSSLGAGGAIREVEQAPG
ncbi:ABC-F family ATP-binding cassette domain-containing protein, partial [Nocardia tengchongensis]|uniref:ABC-F family ATP-binding cassette domain-containing protein n=1 Tax=Nocardia tengchongensis TaxID=2055889 RepID=UPI00367CDFE7